MRHSNTCTCWKYVKREINYIFFMIPNPYIYNLCMLSFLFNIYFFWRYTSVQVKIKISVMCLIFPYTCTFLTKSSISAPFRMRRTHVSPSPVLSTPPWETSISSCLPRSQYISVFSVLISLFDIGGFSS